MKTGTVRDLGEGKVEYRSRIHEPIISSRYKCGIQEGGDLRAEL